MTSAVRDLETRGRVLFLPLFDSSYILDPEMNMSQDQNEQVLAARERIRKVLVAGWSLSVLLVVGGVCLLLYGYSGGRNLPAFMQGSWAVLGVCYLVCGGTGVWTMINLTRLVSRMNRESES